MSIDPTSDRPVYKQIADYFREAIRGGQIQPGAMLPSESELVQQYGVSRVTVRKALAILAGEGRITIEHGRGAYVRKPPPVIRLGASRFSRQLRETGDGAFAAETKRFGMTPRYVLRQVGETTAPARIAQLLRIAESDPVIVRRRLMFADDMPMQLADSYFPASWARGTQLAQADTGPGGSYARIEEVGHRLSRFREELQARMPDPDEAKMLLLAPGVPVVQLLRVAYDAADTPVEVFDSVVAADKHIFAYEFEAPE